MKNILKSYWKMFLKAWIETFGTLIFISLFVMLIIGMLAAPLQISFQSNNIKSKTNLWDIQMQGEKKYDLNFINDFIIEGKEYRLKYNDNNYLKLEALGSSWLTDEALNFIDLITEYNYLNNQSTVCSHSNNQIECEQTYKLNYKANKVYEYIRKYQNYSSNFSINESYINENNNVINVQFSIENLFTDKAEQRLIDSNSLRSFNNFVMNSLLEQISNIDNTNFGSFYKYRTTYTNDLGRNVIYNIDSYNQNQGANREPGKELNNLILSEGRLPKKVNPNDEVVEVIVNDLYAKDQNWKLNEITQIIIQTGGDENISNPNKILNIKPVGYGNKFSTLTPVANSVIDDYNKNYAQIYVDKTFFDEDNWYSKNINSNYQFQTGKMWLSQDVLVKDFNKDIDFNNLFVTVNDSEPKIFVKGTNLFKTISSHNTISALVYLYIITLIYAVLGLILLLLALTFILSIIKKEINSTKVQLGIFKANGYRTFELSWIFTIKVFITIFIGVIIGYCLSIPIQINAAQNQYKGIVLFEYETIIVNPIFLLILILFVPILFSLIAYLFIYKNLNQNSLLLLNNVTKDKKGDFSYWFLAILFFPSLIVIAINKFVINFSKKKNIWFTYRLQNSFISRSKTKFALILSIFGLSTFLISMQIRSVSIMQQLFKGELEIYNKKLDHYYSYDNANSLSITDKIILDNQKPNYDLDYLDISKNNLAEYTNSQLMYINQISELIKSVNNIRTNIITHDTLTIETKLKLNLLILIYDLNKLNDLNSNLITTNESLDNLLYSIIYPSSKNNYISLLNLKFEYQQNNIFKKTGMYFNDIGKYFCISTADQNISDCNNLILYKETIAQSFKTKTNKNTNFTINSTLQKLFIDFMNVDNNINPILVPNLIAFNQETDFLYHSLSYSLMTSDFFEDSQLILLPVDSQFGNPKNVFEFNNISNSKISNLKKFTDGNYIPVIISNLFSKKYDKKINDVFEISIGKFKSLNQKVKIIAIDNSDLTTQNIYTDYNLFFNHFLSDELKESDKVYFNNLASTNLAFKEGLNYTKIKDNIDSLNSLKEVLTIGVDTNLDEDSTWLSSLLDIYFKEIYKSLSTEKQEKLKGTLESLGFKKTNNFEYIISGTIFNNLNSISLEKEIINSKTTKIVGAMILFTLFTMIILTIIYIVLLNIIISDSRDIISVLKAFGYSNLKINWIVIGKYLINLLVMFIAVYLFAIIAWIIIQAIIWNFFNFLIAIPYSPLMLLMSFSIVSISVLIGWMIAYWKVKNKILC